MTTIQETRTQAGKYLAFNLGPETYGVPVLQIREIIRLVTVTPVPGAPAYVKGVINLRGKLIPVIDLDAKLGLTQNESTERTCIVVVQVKRSDGTTVSMGIQVDDVQEVLQVAPGDIDETPDFGGANRNEYLLGIARLKNRVAMLLDIDRTLVGDTASLSGLF